MSDSQKSDEPKLEAGRELDALIHEKLFGEKVPVEKWEWVKMSSGEIDGQIICTPTLPAYSTDIAAAFRIVKRFTDSKISFGIDYDVEYGFNKKTGWSIAIDGVSAIAFRETLPLAVCLAALQALKWENIPYR